MTGLIIAAIILVALAVALLYRIFRGPTAADRMAALDAMDLLAALAMALYSLYSGRGISTDIVGAGIQAYLSALNKIVYEEETV